MNSMKQISAHNFSGDPEFSQELLIQERMKYQTIVLRRLKLMFFFFQDMHWIELYKARWISWLSHKNHVYFTMQLASNSLYKLQKHLIRVLVIRHARRSNPQVRTSHIVLLSKKLFFKRFKVFFFPSNSSSIIHNISLPGAES